MLLKRNKEQRDTAEKTVYRIVLERDQYVSTYLEMTGDKERGNYFVKILSGLFATKFTNWEFAKAQLMEAKKTFPNAFIEKGIPYKKGKIIPSKYWVWAHHDD